MYGEDGGLLEESLSEVLTAANTLPSAPVASVRRLMWSSAWSLPESGTSSLHVESGAPSVWIAKKNAPRTSLDHMTPIAPRIRTIAEMSSAETLVPPTAGANGVVHTFSLAAWLCASSNFECCV